VILFGMAVLLVTFLYAFPSTNGAPISNRLSGILRFAFGNGALVCNRLLDFAFHVHMQNANHKPESRLQIGAPSPQAEIPYIL
jgi:hypothetical protein